jgi:glutamate--cysteine ligase
MPHGTSLRMGRLGYQSDAQASLAVSYNGLEGYANSLHEALTRPYPAYEAVGIRNPGGDYNQLATTLLQIENEFYGTIRPKRVIFQGERPLHALRERGVEYVEVRCWTSTRSSRWASRRTPALHRHLLLHCLLADSPPDTPQEIDELKNNQHLTAARGREPGLALLRNGREVKLVDWGIELIDAFGPIAKRLDDGPWHARLHRSGRAGRACGHGRPGQPGVGPGAGRYGRQAWQLVHQLHTRAIAAGARRAARPPVWTGAAGEV